MRWPIISRPCASAVELTNVVITPQHEVTERQQRILPHVLASGQRSPRAVADKWYRRRHH